MTFDLAKVPGGDVAAWGAECRAKALEGVREGDWRTIHDWTRSWIGWGGGAWLPDTWLLYAVSALVRGQPRGAVHSLDLGLKFWIGGPTDRAALTWCRGLIVMERLADPKTALLDLQQPDADLPVWVEAAASTRLARCSEAAGKSRKRVPSVSPRPEFQGPGTVIGAAAPDVAERSDGAQPQVWSAIARFFVEPVA